MNQVTLFIFAVLAIVVVLVVFSYLHKRHVEYKMVDIENAVRSAYSEGVTSVEKEALVKAVKKYFHCSSKEAHYNRCSSAQENHRHCRGQGLLTPRLLILFHLAVGKYFHTSLALDGLQDATDSLAVDVSEDWHL